MDKEFIRTRFKDYRKQIADLQYTLEEQYYYAEAASSRAYRQAEACRRESAERERQAEADRWYRDDKIKTATNNLNRAISYGDQYGIHRAQKELQDAQNIW